MHCACITGLVLNCQLFGGSDVTRSFGRVILVSSLCFEIDVVHVHVIVMSVAGRGSQMYVCGTARHSPKRPANCSDVLRIEP